MHISVQNIPPPAAVDKLVLPDIDSALQEQERIITMSYALASEASLKSKQVAGKLTSSITTNLNWFMKFLLIIITDSLNDLVNTLHFLWSIYCVLQNTVKSL